MCVSWFLDRIGFCQSIANSPSQSPTSSTVHDHPLQDRTSSSCARVPCGPPPRTRVHVRRFPFPWGMQDRRTLGPSLPGSSPPFQGTTQAPKCSDPFITTGPLAEARSGTLLFSMIMFSKSCRLVCPREWESLHRLLGCGGGHCDTELEQYQDSRDSLMGREAGWNGVDFDLRH